MAFTKKQIIEIANRRTENRGKSLELDSEFLTALQSVCLEKRWWWRRKIVAFSLVAGQSEYHLLDPQSIDAGDFQQVAKKGFKIFALPGSAPTYLTPSQRSY